MPDFEEEVGDEPEPSTEAFAPPLADEESLDGSLDEALDSGEQLASDDDTDDDASETFDPELAAFLAETFQQELRELLGAVPEMLGGLADPAQQANLCADLSRIFHTVKGSAATVGRNDLRDVGKTLQDEFDRYADEATLPLPPEFIEGLSGPIETVFLSAGLEPPMVQLELAAATAHAFLADDDAPAPPSLRRRRRGVRDGRLRHDADAGDDRTRRRRSSPR